MVCIDQFTGVRGDEPLATLAKTRRVDGRTYFGRHVCLGEGEIFGNEEERTVMVGDRVVPVDRDDDE